MARPEPPVRIIRFGVYEVDLQAGELRRQGLRIKLQEKPFQVLALLLEHPGEVVTREELQQRLWPDTFVDFEHSLSTAIKKLRDALGDAAENPVYIETRPGRGYRFIYPVEEQRQEISSARPRRLPRWAAALGLVGLPGLLVAVFTFNVGGVRDRVLGRPVAGEITSIAVLPLKNLSGDPKQDYFVEGMHDSVIAELSKVSALKVISRTSVVQFKEAKVALPEIARKLNVDAVVEGSVLREGNQVRITVQLIHGSTERQLWTRSFDRELGGILILYREVARAIADEVHVALTPAEKTRLEATRTVRPEAHEAFLKGLSIWGQFREDSALRSMEYFRQAIALDPSYALAYARLAFANTLAFDFPPAKEAALKALEIDDQVAEAYAALAFTSWMYDWDWVAAERSARRALELDPNSGVSHHVYGMYLSSMGRHEEAIAAMQRAAEIEPLVPLTIINLAGVYFDARQYDRARQVMQNCMEMDPKCAARAHRTFGQIYSRRGMYEQALEECEKVAEIIGEPPRSTCPLIHAAAGRRSEARAVLRELKAEAVPNPRAIAALHAALGEKDEAFAWLEKAYEHRHFDLILLKVSGIWDPLRGDPRFQALLRRMNFPE